MTTTNSIVANAIASMNASTDSYMKLRNELDAAAKSVSRKFEARISDTGTVTVYGGRNTIFSGDEIRKLNDCFEKVFSKNGIGFTRAKVTVDGTPYWKI